MKYNLAINNQKFEVEVGDYENGCVGVTVNGQPFSVYLETTEKIPDLVQPVSAVNPTLTPSDTSQRNAALTAKTPAPAFQSGAVVAPISGLILDIKVKIGDTVKVGQTVAILEAMKMENNLTTSIAGTVKEIRVQRGNEIATGDVIIIIDG